MINTERNNRYYISLLLLLTGCTSDSVGVRSDPGETLLMLLGLAFVGSFIYVIYLLVKGGNRYITNNARRERQEHTQHKPNDAEYFEKKHSPPVQTPTNKEQPSRIISETLFSVSQTIFPNLIDHSNPQRKKAWAEEYLLCLRQFIIMAGDHKEFHSEDFIIQLYNAVNTIMKQKIGIEISYDNELEFIQDKVTFYNEEVNNTVIAARNKTNYVPFKLLYSLYINPLATVKNVEDRAGDHFANNLPLYMIQYKVFLDNYPLIVTEIDKILKSYKKGQSEKII